MSYQATLDYLFSKLPMYQRIGAAAYKANLDNITALCEHLGNPQNRIKCVHIAGTNGKGSVTHLLAAALQLSGYKVGVYSSPHYRDFRERIKINGNYITEQAVVDFVAKNQSYINELEPSFFEMATAMAFEYFADEQVDFAIIETGLGGRLDSTNIISPILSVITNISFDHQQFLGDTLPLIAAEKAGIIKNNTPVVIGERQDEIVNVFIKKATDCNAPIYFASDRFETIHHPQIPLNPISNNYTIIDKASETLVQSLDNSELYGSYQLKNIATAFAAAKVLQETYNISLNGLKEGFERVKSIAKLYGRWDVLSLKPLALADSAHNEAGIKELMLQLAAIPFNQLHIVFGMVNDKSPEKALSQLPKDALFYFCKPNIPRGQTTEVLQEYADMIGLKSTTHSSVKNAFDMALMDAQENDLVLICGSIFVVAELV